MLSPHDRKIRGECPGDTTWRTYSVTFPWAHDPTMNVRIVDQ